MLSNCIENDDERKLLEDMLKSINFHPLSIFSQNLDENNNVTPI